MFCTCLPNKVVLLSQNFTRKQTVKVAQGKQAKSFMQRAAEDCIIKTHWTCPAATDVSYVQQQRTTLPSVTVLEGSTPGLHFSAEKGFVKSTLHSKSRK
jgi:hypothetical protein